MGVLQQALHHLIEVVVLLLAVEDALLVSLYKAFELNAPVKLPFILETPVADDVERLGKVLFPVLEERFARLKRGEWDRSLTWCFLFGYVILASLPSGST